jgi:8-oxo-dGTP pyrophosphatase MutT (NUDIX family)
MPYIRITCARCRRRYDSVSSDATAFFLMDRVNRASSISPGEQTLSTRKFTPAVPLRSATVILIRDGDQGPELFLVRRNARTSFGASYVFPGGLVEPADRATHDRCAGANISRADTSLGLDGDALDYYCAAIRELFEETGVLLARDGRGDWALTASPGAASDYARLRRRLNDRNESWTGLLARRGLVLACDELHYVAFWITPLRRPKRFTTRFFVAALPAGQHASHDDGELTDGRWMTAREALAAHTAGDIDLPHPTRATLCDLQAHDSIAAILDWARLRERNGFDCCLPAVVGDAGNERVVMPGHPDYPDER